jgi:hypothetical protein
MCSTERSTGFDIKHGRLLVDNGSSDEILNRAFPDGATVNRWLRQLHWFLRHLSRR